MSVINSSKYLLLLPKCRYWMTFPLKCMSVRGMSTEKMNHLQRKADNTRHEIIADASVTRMKDESKTVKRLSLKIDDRSFSFRPGQWVDMFIPNMETVGGFSICSTPEQFLMTEEVELAVKNSPHPPANWIHTKCKEGSTVKLRVGGDFYLDTDLPGHKPDILLIAGGVGINPLFSMWRHAEDLNIASDDYTDMFGKLMLLYSASTQDELIYHREIAEIEDVSTNLHCQRFITKEKGNHTTIKYRRIEAEDLSKVFHWLNKDVTKAFICGPSSMISDMENILVSLQLPKDRIFYEKWW